MKPRLVPRIELIVGKPKSLKNREASPGDYRNLPIWPTYLEGVEGWHWFYTEDFPKHYNPAEAKY